jgi:DNA-binding transcriptional LysR family regulator
MELHQVRYFLALCAQGSFSRAAQACSVSQPALTTAIRRMEEELGGPLFHRDGRRIVLSRLGQLVLPHLEQLRGGMEAASEAAKNFRLLRDTPIRLGVVPTLGPAFLAKFLQHYRSLMPQAEVAISSASFVELLEHLEHGRLDFALGTAADSLADAFRAETLYREHYKVVFPRGHRFESQSTVSLSDVHGEPYVDRLACELREAVMAVCKTRQVTLYACFRSEREDWIQDLVAAGLGFAFMPEYSVGHEGVASRPLVDPAVERAVAMVEMRGHQRSPSAQAFALELQAFCRRMMPPAVPAAG